MLNRRNTLLPATARTRSELITDTVEQITGAPARGFAQGALEHGDEFR